MDFSKIKSEFAALLKSAPEAAVVESDTKPMTVEQFVEYAKEQVSKAEADHQVGSSDVAQTRLAALAAEVDKIAKFEFKPGELPAVAVFKDPAQKAPEMVATPAGESTPGESNWVAKSEEFGAFLAQAIGALTPGKPAAEVVEDEAYVWPSDLADHKATDDVYDFKA
jgi:hypothetical protein